MGVLAASGFGGWDWGVLGGYVALLVLAGAWLARRGAKGAEDYFLAARSMPAWAVAVSLLATAQSSATFVGVPEQGFGGDLRYLSTNIGTVIAGVVVAAFFLPVYYRLNVATPYQMLETRFGPGARLGASIAYLVGRVMASGARVYIGAVPFAVAVFGDASPTHLLVSIAAFMVFGSLFTLVGGVRSAIWTDVIQVGVYLGAAIALLVVLLMKIPAGPGEIWTALVHPPEGPSKLTVLRVGLDPSKPGWGFDPSDQFTLLTAVFGFSLLNMAAFGTDQDLTQRTLTCRGPARAGWSLVASTFAVTIPVLLLFSTLGLLLYIFYQRPDVMGPAYVGGKGGSVESMIDFAMLHAPAGMAGLVIAGMLAAGPAGINASLNSMASSFVADVYRPLRPDRDETHYLTVGRLGTVGAGVLLALFAGVCVVWREQSGGTFIDFALRVMTFAYAGLLGVFLVALFTRRGSGASAVAALVTGFAAVLVMQPWAWRLWAPLVGLGEMKLAYPWQLAIGTAAAALVCAAAPGGIIGPNIGRRDA